MPRILPHKVIFVPYCQYNITMKKFILSKKSKILSAALLVFVVAIVLTIGLLHVRSDDEQENSHYQMTLSYDAQTHQLSGQMVATFFNSYDNMFTSLQMHLYPNAFRQGATASVVSSNNYDKAYPNGESFGNIEIASVTKDGSPLSFEVEGSDQNILRIDLGQELYPDEKISFSVDFTTTLANINHRLGYGENTINFGNFYPIFAVYESGKGFSTSLYHSNGDPFYSECADYDVTISYPSSMQIASSGNFISSTERGDTTSSQFSGKNIRDFCFVLSSKFSHASTKVGSTIVNYYGYTSDKDIDKNLQTAKDAMQTFNKLFGDYPYQQVSVVKSNFVHGGMEYPNLVLISDDLDAADIGYVIIHELAHQWWYGVVGNDEYNHAWLDEGLTEFSTLLFYKENPSYGNDFDQMIDATQQSYKTFVRAYTSVQGSVDTSMERALCDFATEPEYVQCTYVKGVLMFNSVYETVGQRKFLKALRDYYEDFAFKNATPADMIASFSHSTGYDLEGYFNSFLSGDVIIQ